MRRYENQQLQDRGVSHFSVTPFLQLYLQKQNFVTIVFGSFGTAISQNRLQAWQNFYIR